MKEMSVSQFLDYVDSLKSCCHVRITGSYSSFVFQVYVYVEKETIKLVLPFWITNKDEFLLNAFGKKFGKTNVKVLCIPDLRSKTYLGLIWKKVSFVIKYDLPIVKSQLLPLHS